MIKRFFFVVTVQIAACMLLVTPYGLAEESPEQTLYILPFNPGGAPADVSASLFDALVARIYELGEQKGVQVTIVKQELTNEDADWFAGKQYLIGEAADYSEEKGCCYTELKLTGQIQLHLPEGNTQPILTVSDEAFFNHDITPLPMARAELFDRLAGEMAERLMLQITSN